MNVPVIYSATDSTRLRYVLDWIFDRQLHCGYRLTTNFSEEATIYYGSPKVDGISIPSHGLLFQKDIAVQDVNIGSWKTIPTFFSTSNIEYSLSFDLFSSVFYLLSRYEEYYPYTGDKHGRYPAEESILYKYGILDRPIVDEWIEELRSGLVNIGFNVPAKRFTYNPTYDIDIAYSYKHKGLKRNVGGFLRDFIIGNVPALSHRTATLFGNVKDPYDSFDFINALHARHNLSPIFFILSARKISAFDKNIPLLHPSMRHLVESFIASGKVGIHPSYLSSKNSNLLKEEKADLEYVSGTPISLSRQHYIRFSLPGTYRQLIDAGITNDYSLGYGAHLGFRAGTGASFLWYDLKAENISSLTVHPFCFMDTAAHHAQNMDADKAFNVLQLLTSRLKKVNSTLTTVFHNFSLGTDPDWKDWNKKYAQFLDSLFTS